MKKTLLFILLICASAFGYAQVQPVVYNATFNKIAKSSGSDCACAGWINKDIADQGESSTVGGDDVGKLDDLESDGFYQEVAVVPNSDYTLDLEFKYDSETTTTTGLEVYVLKGSAYASGYTPAYAPPATAAQDGFGYETVAQVETAANQLAFSTTIPPGDTDFNAITQITFNTGSETSIAIFIRAVGPYLPASHGDASKDKGWMNGDTEVRIDNLALVNTTSLSSDNFAFSNLKVYPNPANTSITIKSSNIQIESVEVFNMLGKNVLKSRLVEDKLNVSDLASGVYMLRINSAEASTTKRIVIN